MYMKMFRFVQKVFFIGLTILSDLTNENSLSCISMNNQECKTRPQVINVNGDEPVFFPFSIETSKGSGSCNNINYPYAKICVPDVVKNLNVKIFNLMSRTNERRFIEWHETYKCECKFGANICNNKQRGIKINADVNAIKECAIKDLFGILVTVTVNACGVGEYLDYENCKCRKKLFDKLVDECTETVEEVKLAKITLAENKNGYKCSSCTVYTVLFWIFLTINVVGIGDYFIYSRYFKMIHMLNLIQALK